MKIKVDTQTLNALKVNVDNMIMMNNHLYCITELESVKEEREIVKPKTWFCDEEVKKVTEYFVTKIVIESVHSEGKFLGTLTDEACENIICFYNIYKLRQNWLDIKNQIDLFGYTIVAKAKPEIKAETNLK